MTYTLRLVEENSHLVSENYSGTYTFIDDVNNLLLPEITTLLDEGVIFATHEDVYENKTITISKLLYDSIVEMKNVIRENNDLRTYLYDRLTDYFVEDIEIVKQFVNFIENDSVLLVLCGKFLQPYLFVVCEAE